MLHLKFALSLEHLANEMEQKIRNCWKNPFMSPIVIFPDPKLEQWFRLFWVRKNGTLAGFNSMMIDRFLMEILVKKDEDKQKLGAEMLRNVILAYIYRHKDGLDEIDDTGEVARYLLTEDGKLDENRLFDFAGKMASLFLEYETSRPSNFVKTKNGDAKGILDCWSQEVTKESDKYFFTGKDGKATPHEKWQRNLYSKIFHKNESGDSILDNVFKEVNRRRNEGKSCPRNVTYLTLPFLFKTCDGFNCEKFTGDDGKPLPVFIFGLSGMGQFYRVILEEFSKEHEVMAYIQNPCMEFWEDLASEKTSRKNLLKWNKKEKVWREGLREENSSKEVDAEIKGKLRISLKQDDGDTDAYDDERESGVNATNENALLCYWGKSGRDNIKLWCAGNDYDFEFSEDDELNHKLNRAATAGKFNSELSDELNHKLDRAATANPSLLRIVQQMVASRTNVSDELLSHFEATATAKGAFSCDETDDGSDRSLTLTGAPTKIREMEILHSRICKLMQKGAHVSDILVVSPNLDDYRTAICQAFDQNERGNGLHVPFSIVDSPAKSSLVGSALSAIFDILNRGSINRPDFFALVKNPVVMATRHIGESDVDAFVSWVEEINIYRDRNVVDGDSTRFKEDWKNGIRRLLLGRFTTCYVQYDEDNELQPHFDIASANSRLLCKFIDIIDDLETILAYKKQNEGIPESKLDEFAEFLSNFLAMQNPTDNLAGENVIYQDVLKSFDNLRCQYYAGVDTITWECLEATLRGTAECSAYSCGSLFVNGVTFTKFIPNRIVPVKHLFFIGADSGSFPGAKPSGMMDLRRTTFPWPGDDSPVAKRRYAFLSQFMSTSESFSISYVSKNIVKDEELYPTSIVNDIRSFFKNAIRQTVTSHGENFEEWKKRGENKDALKNVWPEIAVSLDEDRPYSELFTEREIRNKKLLSKEKPSMPGPKMDGENANNESTGPDRVSITQLKNFLSDPFQFRISQMMQQNNVDEDDVEPESVLYEPVDFNHLGYTSLVNKMVAAEISNDAKKELEEFERGLKLKGVFPDGEYEAKLKDIANKRCANIIAQMEKDRDAGETRSPRLDSENWTYREKIDELRLVSNDQEFLLTGTFNFRNADNLASLTSSKIRSEGNVRKGTKVFFFKKSKFLSNYLCALALIAQKGGNDAATVNLGIYSSNDPSAPSGKATVKATPAEARSTLQKIYRLAYQERYSKCVPVDFLDEKDPLTDFYKFCDKLEEEHGPWTYFGKRHLFDKKRDIGFTPGDTFADEWKKAAEQQNELLKHLEIICEPAPSKESAQKDDTKTSAKKGASEKAGAETASKKKPAKKTSKEQVLN